VHGLKTQKEFTMKKHILLTLLVITLTAGMLFVSCGKDQDEEQRKALEGTWVLVEMDGSGFASGSPEEAIVFNNGNFELKYNGISEIKGTYSTGGGTLTMTPTHFKGSTDIGLENRWYSKDEVKQYLKQRLESMGQTWTADIDREIEEEFAPQARTFSVNGNTLTLTDKDGRTEKYTNK
jgi:hypothetical protein